MTHVMLLPARVLVPRFSRKDIGTAIVIEIADGACLADAEIDSLALERNFRTTRRKTYQRRRKQRNRSK